MYRRELIATTSAAFFASLAGCIGGGGQLEQVEFDESLLIAHLEDDHDVDSIEVISEDGSRIHDTDVGSETRVEVMNVFSSITGDGLTTLTGDSVTVRAFDTDGDSIGEAEIVYDPAIELSTFDIDLENGDIEFEVENTGDGPVQISLGFEFLDRGVIGVEEDTGEQPYPSDSFFLPLSDDVDGTILESGETHTITTDGLEDDFSEESIDPLAVSDDTITSRNEELTTATVTDEAIEAVLEIEIDTEPESVSTTYVAEMVFSDISADMSQTDQRETWVSTTYEYEVSYQIGDHGVESIDEQDG